MEQLHIDDPQDRSYPFRREVFEDRNILYHGTWSPYRQKIESDGIILGNLPFDSKLIIAIIKARQAVGLDSWMGWATERIEIETLRSLPFCFTPSFWGARAYATDGGGELVRKTIDDANDFERFYLDPTARMKLIKRWSDGLEKRPDDSPTQSALKTLNDPMTMESLYHAVVSANEELKRIRQQGHPVVYALRVEPIWFGEQWDRYIAVWKHGRSSQELQLKSGAISPDRIVGKAEYPNGTDMNFMPSWCTRWEDVETIHRDADPTNCDDASITGPSEVQLYQGEVGIE